MLNDGTNVKVQRKKERELLTRVNRACLQALVGDPGKAGGPPLGEEGVDHGLACLVAEAFLYCLHFSMEPAGGS